MFAFQHKFEVVVGDAVYRCHKLSAKNLRQAAEAHANSQVETLRTMGADLFRVIREDTPEVKKARENYEAKKEAAEADFNAKAEQRYASYDPLVVVRLGVEGWSYVEPVTEANIEALAQEDVDVLSRRILDESLPPIDPAAQKAAEGKDSGASTSS